MPTQAEMPSDQPTPEASSPVEAQVSPDRDIVDALLKGDKHAFAALVARYQGSIFGYLRARLLQSSDAEDLTQEVFFRCYRNLDKFEPTSSMRPWLLGIARNVLSEYVRKMKRRREVAWTRACLELDALTEATPEAAPQVELTEQLPTCLDSLANSARQAIEMRYDNRLPLAEIGQKLRRSEGAARLLMFRARQALKNCLTRKTQDDDA